MRVSTIVVLLFSFRFIAVRRILQEIKLFPGSKPPLCYVLWILHIRFKYARYM